MEVEDIDGLVGRLLLWTKTPCQRDGLIDLPPRVSIDHA